MQDREPMHELAHLGHIEMLTPRPEEDLKSVESLYTYGTPPVAPEKSGRS